MSFGVRLRGENKPTVPPDDAEHQPKSPDRGYRCLVDSDCAIPELEYTAGTDLSAMGLVDQILVPSTRNQNWSEGPGFHTVGVMKHLPWMKVH